MADLSKEPTGKTKYVVLERKHTGEKVLKWFFKNHKGTKMGDLWWDDLILIGYAESLTQALSNMGTWVPKLYSPA